MCVWAHAHRHTWKAEEALNQESEEQSSISHSASKSLHDIVDGEASDLHSLEFVSFKCYGGRRSWPLMFIWFSLVLFSSPCELFLSDYNFKS